MDIESLFNSQTKNIDNRHRFYRHIRRNRIPRELLQIITGVIVNTHEYADIIPVSFQKHPSPTSPYPQGIFGNKANYTKNQTFKQINRFNYSSCFIYLNNNIPVYVDDVLVLTLSILVDIKYVNLPPY